MSGGFFAASRRRKLSIRLHRWHRRIGVLASVFLIWMSLSGWLLNHTGALDLARIKVHASWILQRYGIKNDMPTQEFMAAPHWLVVTPDATWFDGKIIAASLGKPLGMVASNRMIFVASAAQLHVLADDGALIDTIDASQLPIANIARIGSGCGGVAIADATKIFASNDGANWQPCDADIVWAISAPLTTAQQQQIKPLLQPGVSLERVILDLHSGRFLGAWGPYFVDALGLGLTLLALSGLWMYSQQRRRRQLRAHSDKKSE